MKQKLSTRELIEELQSRGYQVYPADKAPIYNHQKQNLKTAYAKFQMAFANDKPKNRNSKKDH